MLSLDEVMLDIIAKEKENVKRRMADAHSRSRGTLARQCNAYGTQMWAVEQCPKGNQAGKGKAHAAQGGWGGVAMALSSPAALHTVGQSVTAHGSRDEFTGTKRRGLRSSRGLRGDGRSGAPHVDDSTLAMSVACHLRWHRR